MSGSLSNTTLNTLKNEFAPEYFTVEALHLIADIAAGRDLPTDVYSSNSLVTKTSFPLIVEAVKEIFLLAAGQNWDVNKILTELPTLGDETQTKDIALQIHTVLTVRYSELRRQIIENASTFSSYYLKDIDWVVKLVLASNTASVLKDTLLMVTLHLISRIDQSNKTIQLELNKAELDTLIESLSNAAKVVTSYSS